MIIDLFPENSEKRAISYLEKVHKYQLSTIKIGFSEKKLDAIRSNYKIYSNFLQNIHYFTHNNFEIELLVDVVEGKGLEILSKLGKTEAEIVFLQFISLYLLKNKFNIKFLNFRKFYIDEKNFVKFKLDFDYREDKDDLSELTEIFRNSFRFKNINKSEIIEVFRSLVPIYRFDKNEAWFYIYDDFASSIIDSYPISILKGNENISIKVDVKDPVKKKFIKNNLFNNFLDKSSLLINIDSNVDNIFLYISRIFLKKETKKSTDFEKVFSNIGNFLKESTFTSIIFVIDTQLNNKDREFLRFLFKGSGISKLYFIFFEDGFQGVYDLVLTENGKNYLKDILTTGKRQSLKKMLQIEKNIIKTVYSFPLTIFELNKYLPLSEKINIDNLINNGNLEKKGGRLFPLISPKSLIPTKYEEIFILKELSVIFGYPEINLKLSLLNFDPSMVSKILDKMFRTDLQGRGDRFPFHFISGLLYRNIRYFKNEDGIVKKLILILLKEMDLKSAKDMIKNYGYFDDPFFELKLCEISFIEMDYKETEKIITKLQKSWPEELRDEIFLYTFLLKNAIGDYKKAFSIYNKIKNTFNKRLADIKYSRKILDCGEVGKAESILAGSSEFFIKQGSMGNALRVAENKSEIEWLKGEKKAALKIRKNIYLQSEIRGYKVLAGQFSLGLGKFFLLEEDYIAAEFWLQKSIEIFKKENIRYGVKSARLNYSKINLVKGNWREAEKDLRTAGKLDGDTEKIPEPGNYFFYRSILEFFRHNYSLAEKFAIKSILIFERGKNLYGTKRSKLLKLLISLSSVSEDNSQLNSCLKMLEDYEPGNPVHAVFKVFFKKSAGDRKKKEIEELINKMDPDFLKFLILEFFTRVFKDRGFLNKLKDLSSRLSDGKRNYFFYQYYFIYFSYFFKFDEKLKNEKELFFDTFYFFSDNNRKPDGKFENVKKTFDEKSFEIDVFKNAELVGKYIKWRIPEDIFKSFYEELNLIDKAEMIRLIIYDKGKKIFNFKTSTQFNGLLNEIMEKSMTMAEESEFIPDDIKTLFKSEERAFYYYKTTRTYLWKISGEIFGILLIAYLENQDHKKNTEKKIRQLFKNFAPLMANYINIDYKIDKKLGNIIGEAPSLKDMKKKILKVGKVDFSLLINGKSGTGKELVAKAVHLIGKRSEGPFVPVNSPSIPGNLLESELFGYMKGAFTDAKEDKAGLIEAANGGTLFLDEIGELPVELQAKLLRVLQENELKRIGENTYRKIDMRLICATNRNLKEMIENGTFREDLYYRIQDLVIDVPSLRERVEDIPLLARYFLNKYGFSFNRDEEFESMVEDFKNREWPGNIRELESNIKRIITYYPDKSGKTEAGEDPEYRLINARDNFERMFILKVLKKNNWNKTKSAIELGISRPYLFTLLKKYNLDKTKESRSSLE